MNLHSLAIERLREQIAELQAEETQYMALSEEQQLAEFLHKKLCYGNHIDGCGWEYESWNTFQSNKNNAHTRYFDMSKQLLLIQGPETIVRIVNVLKGAI